MKKLFFLPLFFAAQVAFSNINVNADQQVQSVILEQDMPDPGLPQSFMIDLEDGYVLVGATVMAEDGTYSYSGMLTLNGEVVGAVGGSFQLNELSEANFVDEIFTNTDAEAVVKAKHNAVKNALVNVR